MYKRQADGCVVASGTLISQSAGTCIVTATKAADSNYDAVSSNATTIALAIPAVPSRLTTTFVRNKSTLSAGAKSALRVLAKKLRPGATVTITGYAKSSSSLARRRAVAVANYLKTLVKLVVVVKTVTSSVANKATVTTNKQ